MKMGSQSLKSATSSVDSIMMPVLEESDGYLDEESGELTVGNDDDDDKGGSSNNSQPDEIAKRETAMVNYSKVLVVGVIFLVATCIGAITYLFIRGQEDDNYKKQYENVVNEIISTSQLRARTIFDNLETLAVSLTAQAIDLEMEWPYVVFPHFQVQGMLSNQITGADTLTVHPIVWHKDRPSWENFSVANLEWMATGHMYDKHVDPKLYQDIRLNETMEFPFPRTRWNESEITPFISSYDERWRRVVDFDGEFYIPMWQRAPAEDYNPNVNVNLGHIRNFERFVRGMMRYDQAVLTRVSDANYLASNYDRRFEYTSVGPPHSYLFQPIYDTLFDNRTIVGVLNAFLRWDNFFMNVLPDSEEGIMLIVDGTCNQTYSFQLNGKNAVFLNNTDLHDEKFEDMRRDFEFAPFAMLKDVDDQQLFCQYSARIYPSEEWQSQFFTNQPFTYAAAVISCFLLTTSVFIIYDVLVQRRQKKVLETANKTNKIVSNLFPSNVRDRLMELDKEEKKVPKNKNTFLNSGPSMTNALEAADEENRVTTSETIFGSKPIADLFPSTTIMFADMCGFTAWSSVREPTQVFTLLETVYYSFDSIAKRRRVFKVETIGDCYVSCCGLPMPRKDHHIVMARFANDCLDKMNELCHELETTLGPDTADLCMRIGLHSGPVTAGVLRGEKGRFQLFGDTMNTASRMESTGEKNRIQVSRDTADLLIASGKGKWLAPREDKVQAKGKGELETFWLRVNVGSVATSSAGTVFSEFGNDDALSSLALQQPMSMGTSNADQEESQRTKQRLVQWNVDVLSKILKQMIARRASNPPKSSFAGNSGALKRTNNMGQVLDEVKDILALPQFDAKAFRKMVDPATIKLSPSVQSQLTKFVGQVAELYRANPFHSFEHASHVTMSVTKLLSRIVNPNEVATNKGEDHVVAENLHDHTFGITSDPLTQFACVVSALIHDADHPGVSNAVLVAEKDPMAARYKGKSVAEQNSVNLAWELLMRKEFADLQACIYTNEDEFSRFRQIIVNIVLATDIMDKELGALRRARWEKAFSDGSSVASSSSRSGGGGGSSTTEKDANNRKATIILEHLIQASDVAHTMQHWHVYRKWNERLFQEVYISYLEGRIDKDPSEGWYQGEIGFFDYYIIPLAKKLETCGVFGVSSDEYLNYALNNRKEWIDKGQGIVEGYLSTMGRRKNNSPVITDITEMPSPGNQADSGEEQTGVEC